MIVAAAGIGEIGAEGAGEAARVAVGAAVALAIGLAALAPRSAGRALAAVPLAGALGLALLTPALLLLWWLGLPAAPPTVLGAGTLLCGGFVLGRRLGGGRRPGRRPAGELEPGSAPGEPDAGAFDSPHPPARWLWLLAAAWLPAAAALALFAWKLARVPLWSWDHYAIWGLKARRLFPGGDLDLAWLVPGEHARPDYPIGLPLAWRALTLGAEPGPAAFVLAHLLMAVALVALVGAAGRRLAGGKLVGGGSAREWLVVPTLAGAAAAALTAASPLVWDTESLGLADLPLALYAVAAVAAVAGRIGIAGDPAPPAAPPLWAGGVCLGFLPWIKSEGLPLALLLLAALALALHAARDRRRPRRRALLALALPALALGAAGAAATPALDARQSGFFRDDWAGRGLERLGDLPELLGALAADLLEPGWLGLWVLWVAAAAAALGLLPRTRRDGARQGGRRAGAAAGLALSAAIAAQLTLYAATYVVSYIPTLQHAETSFHRIAAALAPLALLAATAVLGALGGPPAGGRLSRHPAPAAPLRGAGGRG